MVTQYDVEVYQRLEGLLGRKLPELKLDEETVLILHERVSEAQRLATRELKEQIAANNAGRRKRGKNDSKYGNDDGDGDGGLEGIVKNQLRRGYQGGSGGNGGAIGNQRGSIHKKRKNHRHR
jgi:ATP-dependent RNA helicase DDX47/RRP3